MSHTASVVSKTALLAAVLLLFGTALASASAPTHFDWRADTIAFSNDTVFSYGVDESGQLTMHKKEKAPDYAHRCFVLARAVMQFHKFARFAPEQPRVSPDEYRRLTRHISRIPVWFPARAEKERVLIPGYKNLNEFSRGYEHMFKEVLGNWFPTYLRVGNWRMVGPFPRSGQEFAARKLVDELDHGKIQAVYITRFPKMNHCIVLFDHHTLANGDLRFDCYDPNYPNQLGSLLYHPRTRTFDFPKRWFWTGGTVNLMRVYLSPIH
jgi:hypothetical protein